MPLKTISPVAKADLAHLIHYLSSQSEDLASRFHAAVEDACEVLAATREMGALVPSNSTRTDGIRVWQVPRFRNHLIFYRPVNDGIEVVRVLHGARDWQSLLDT